MKIIQKLVGSYARAATVACLTILAAFLSPTIARAADGVQAVGFGGFGQLGNNKTPNTQDSPVQVWGIGSATAVSGGYYHSLVISPGGILWAFGYNADGQLGDGTQVNAKTPVRVGTLTGVTQAVGGYDFSLALLGDGTVWSWGADSAGQLGDGTPNAAKLLPVKVKNLTNIVQIAAGMRFGLALKADGTVWAWGLNSSGQLGNGTKNNKSEPVQVLGLSGVVSIAAGHTFALAVKTDGTVWGWGENGAGQLGFNLPSNPLEPVQIPNIPEAASVACGASHSIILFRDGTMRAMGMNTEGQLGIGTNASPIKTPAPVSGSLTNIIKVAAGEAHSYAMRADGAVFSWGRNQNGQLSIGNTVNRNAPILVTALPNANDIGAGGHHGLAILGEPANITVESIVFDKSAYLPNQAGSFTARIRNTGQHLSGAFRVIFGVNVTTPFSCGASGQGSTTVQPLGPGGFEDVTFAFTAPSANGGFSVRVFADSQCDVTESNEGDNQLQALAFVAQPDLTILSFTLDKSLYKAGDSAQATVAVRNTGGAITQPFRVEFYNNAPTIANCGTTGQADVTVQGLGASETVTLSAQVPLPNARGTFTMRVFVDQGCVVAEQNEANNQATAVYTTTQPDIVVQSITLNKSNYATNETATATVVIRNAGTIGTDLNFAVDLYSQASAAGTIACNTDGDLRLDQDPLGAGATRTLTFVFTTPANTGTFNLAIFADSQCVIAETNELNNVLRTTYNVLPDLTVVSITLNKSQYGPNETATATVVVRNIGPATTAGTFSVDVYNDSPAAESCNQPGAATTFTPGVLVGGGSFTLVMTFQVPNVAGSYTARAFADSKCVELEANEGNNQGTVAYTVAAPDLVIESVTALTPPSFVYAANEPVVVRVVVKNQGTGSTVNGFSVDLFRDQSIPVDCGTVDSVRDARANLSALAAGATVAFNMSFVAPSTVGTFTMRLFVDSQCEINEANEDNNQTTQSYQVRQPDLIVQSIALDKPVYSPGELGRATIVVRNQGSAGTGVGFNTILLAHNPSQVACGTAGDGNFNSAPLNAGATTSFEIEFFAPDTIGNKVLRVFTDAPCAISETIENNNQATLAYNVSRGDLIVQSITLNKSNYANGEAGTATVVIRNQGSVDVTDPFVVDLFRDSPTVADCGTADSPRTDRREIPSLAAGATASFVMNFTTPNTPGTYTLRVFVDAMCEITENSEANNQSTVNYNLPVDLAVTSVVLNKSTFNGGESGTATVVITNVGSSSTGGQFTVALYPNAPNTIGCGVAGSASVNIGPLAGGASTTVNLSLLVPFNIGTYTVRIFANSECLFNEENLANNQGTASYAVVFNNDLCVTPLTLQEGVVNTFRAVDATSQGDANPCDTNFSNGVWFVFSVQCSGTYSVSMAGSGGPTDFAIFTGPCGNLATVSCGGGATRDLLLEAGVQYRLIAPGGVAPPAAPQQIVFNPVQVTLPDLEVVSVTLNPGSFSIGEGGEATVVMRNKGCGSTVVGFNVGLFLHAPTPFACGSLADSAAASAPIPAGGTASVIIPFTAPLIADTYTMRIMLDSDCELTEAFRSNNQATLEYIVNPPPPNDFCAGAIVLTASATTTQNTFFATSTGDPVTSCSNGLNGVWFEFTPTISGRHTISTFGSSFDTVLTIYTGGCGLPIEIACNDDFGGTTRSQVSPILTAGTTYHAMVSGFDGAKGVARILWREPFARKVVVQSSGDPAVLVTLSAADINGTTSGTTTFNTFYNTGSIILFTAPSPSPLGLLFSQWNVTNTLGSTSFGSPNLTISRNIGSNQTLTAVYVPVSNPPAKPTNVSPANASNILSLTPTLRATVFSDPDPGDTHLASRWTMRRGTIGGPVILQTGEDNFNKGSLTVPPGLLTPSETYFWNVQYKSSDGLWSLVSNTTSFTTDAGAVNTTRVLTVLSSPVTNVLIGVAPKDIFALESGNTTFTRTFVNNASIAVTAPSSVGSLVFSEWRNGAALLFTLPTGSLRMSIDRTLTAVYVPFSNPPATPVNVSPTNGATTTNTTPTLVATAFSDPDGDSHVQTQWEITNVATGAVVFRTTSAVNKTSLPVPAGRLALSTEYSWTAQYKDSAGVWSAKSAPTTFWTPDVEGAAIQNNGTPSGP